MNKTQIKTLIDIAIESGKIALQYFHSDSLEIHKKEDNSPVTTADKEISDFITGEITNNFSNISVISEEGQNRTVVGNKFWLIDPIDGTNNFIARKDKFTINISLIEDKTPIFGLIYAPKIEGSPLYYADENNDVKCFLTSENRIVNIEKFLPEDKIRKIITSKRSSDRQVMQYVEEHFPNEAETNLLIEKIGSSYKFCKLISNEADLFINQQPTMEWDTAAGHALILACGGKVLDLDKNILTYQKEGFFNKGFIAVKNDY